ncbi:MAG TPA: formate dehydrogenase accessory sulfurtransferase FdhD [Burkholderiaceae bacterium]|nr:formate dehydrogenase accessory sulfurtransferase FdhD [Burkholderiaceae bacterium]
MATHNTGALVRGPDEWAHGAVVAKEWRQRDGVFTRTDAALAVEVPVALQYNGISHAVMLATPCDLEDFALGFSLSEGILEDAADLYHVDTHRDALGITVALDVAGGAFAALKERRRTLAGRTGCGICGTESLQQVLRPLPMLAPAQWQVSVAALATAGAALAGAQPLLQQTGATHGAAWCSLDGSVLHVREDVGRHNALDKLIGALRRAQIPTERGFVLITSRASVEMVQKAATAGVCMLAAVSAPTSLALEIAQRCGLTLIGFARGASFSVYTHQSRIAGVP